MEEWRYFSTKGFSSLPFPSLITMLFTRAKVPWEAGDHIIECNMPFDLLRVNGASGRRGMKRKANSNNEDSKGQGVSEGSPSMPTDPFEQMEEQLSAI